MEISVDILLATFFEEACELLSVIESMCLRLEQDAGDQAALNEMFRATHSIKGGAATLGFADITRLTHEQESLLDVLRDGTRALDAELSNILLSSIDFLRLLIEHARSGTSAEPEHVEDALAALQRAAADCPEVAVSADIEPGSRDEARRGRAAARGSTLRVSTERLDQLVNLIGELMISEEAILQALELPPVESQLRVREAMARMTQNTRELQEQVMAVRMVPLGRVFARFPRLVRDLSHGRRLSLELAGEATEIDKEMIEKIVDPLTHLVRNAADHGIESVEERLAAGKSEIGTIRIAASHQGGSVVIEVSDDGRGLDQERIRARALQSGMIHADEEVSRERLQSLVFEPGFSTSKFVTDVSGRGVGLDVVRSNIESLGGAVSLDSTEGVGTRFRIRLPLTLAIMDGLLLRVGAQKYVLPLANVVESFRPHAEQLRVLPSGLELARVRNRSLPLLRLCRVLNVPPETHDAGKSVCVLIETESGQFGLLVDELLGQAQVVVKSLETHYRHADGLIGATILGDGQVVLILDAAGIARLAFANGSPNLGFRGELEGNHGRDFQLN